MRQLDGDRDNTVTRMQSSRFGPSSEKGREDEGAKGVIEACVGKGRVRAVDGYMDNPGQPLGAKAISMG